jgi:hypothetical protein
MSAFIYGCLLVCLAAAWLVAQAPSTGVPDSAYVLGPEDQLNIRVLDLDKFDPKTLGVIRVDLRGNIHLPLAGRIHASGLTVEQLEKEITGRLSRIGNPPEVTVASPSSAAATCLSSAPSRTPASTRSPAARPCSKSSHSPEVSTRTPATRSRSRAPSRPVLALPLADSARDPTSEFYVGELNAE